MKKIEIKKAILASVILFMGCSASEEPSSPVGVVDPSTSKPLEQNVVKVSVEPVMAEIKLIDAQDDPRGWCVDLFAHRKGAMPLGGMQGHNCFMYFDIGGPTEDQGFDMALFAQTGQLKVSYFDVCMQVYDAESKHGSFVAAEGCTGGANQSFNMTDDGRILSDAAKNLCLTLGPTSVPGGGRLPPPGDGIRPPVSNDEIHIIRRLTFDTCSEELAELQKWEFRTGDYVPDESAEQHRFMYSKEK